MAEERSRLRGDILIGGFARHVPTDSTSRTNFELIQKWLTDCTEGHDLCQRRHQYISSPPKRLIYIGDHCDDTIRLIDTASILQNGNIPAYTSLSHCWGHSNHLTTTKESLNTRKLNILWDTLSLTFQDAVVVTREIQIQYIWIDSLCIIQDDLQDWVDEAANMASVYEGATLVLAATSAANGDTGFLSTKREPYLQVQGESYDNIPYKFFARKTRPHDIFNAKIVDHDVVDNETIVRDYPLFSRAWCYQERLLATRILHFTKYEIIFECLSGINCECGRLQGFDYDNVQDLRRIAKLGAQIIPDLIKRRHRKV